MRLSKCRKAITVLGAVASIVPMAFAAKPAFRVSPLSARDIQTGIEAGLGCDFSVGKNTYFVIVEGEALLKSDGTLRHFKLDTEHSLSIINYGGSIGDRDLHVLIDREDRIIQPGEEATTRKAQMTVRRNGAKKMLTGVWTCGA